MQVGRRHRRRRIGVLRVREACLFARFGGREFSPLQISAPPLCPASSSPRGFCWSPIRRSAIATAVLPDVWPESSFATNAALLGHGSSFRPGALPPRRKRKRGWRRREREVSPLSARSLLPRFLCVPSSPRRSSTSLLSRLSRPVRPDIRVVSGVQLVPAHFAEWMIADVMSRPQTVPETSPGFALTLAWL